MSETDPLGLLRAAWLEANIDKMERQAEEIEAKLYGKLPVTIPEQRAYLKEKLASIHEAMGLVVASTSYTGPPA